MTLSVNSILSLKISELLNASKEKFYQYLDTIASSSTTSATDSTDEDSLVSDETENEDFWKGLSEEEKEKLFDAIDTDGNGTLSADELGIYSEIDGDASNISQQDLVELFKELGIETPEDTAETVENTLTSSSHNSYYNSNNNNNTKTDDTSKTPQTAEEARKAIEEKEAKKQETIASETEIVKGYEEEMLKYLQEEGSIKQELLEQYQADNAEIDTKISEKQTQIAEQETTYQENTAQVAALGTSISKIDTQITSLESEYQTAQAKAAQGEENTASDIKTKIDNLKSEKKDLEDEKETAQKAADTAKETKATLEQEKTGLETQKSALKTKLIEDSQSSITQDAKNSIQLVESEIQKIKEDSKTTIAALDSEIASLRTQAAQLEREEETNKVISENSTKADSTPIAVDPNNPYNWEQYGYNAQVGQNLASAGRSVGAEMESQGSQHNCLGGVKRAFLRCYGSSPFGNPGEGIHAAAQTLTTMRNNDNFREVTGLSVNDLDHLPAGAVIVWSTSSGSSAASKYGHISISLGNGQESSDNVRDQYHRVGSNGTPRVFLPIA
jgi:hypothetical protein